MKNNIVLISILMLSSNIARAEGNCPEGQYPIGDQSVQGCAPIPGYQGNAQSSSTTMRWSTRWSTRWGAIAISSKSVSGGPSVVGAATGKASKSKAQKAAIAECRTKGGAKCIVKLAYYNQCATLVWGDRGYNLVNDATQEKATKAAMQSCSNADTNCQIYYSQCSLPERVQ